MFVGVATTHLDADCIKAALEGSVGAVDGWLEPLAVK
jgi:hypothetical protein